MNPFTQYLPPHRPLCLCIGDNAPHLGETNLALPASSREMLPLLKEVGVQYDLISLVIPQRESASIIEELFCDRTGNDLANFMSLLTTRGNLVLFTNSAELDEKIARVQQRWLELKNNHHHLQDWATAHFISPLHRRGISTIEDSPTKTAWLTHREGDYVDATTACPDTAARHAAVCEEWSNRTSPTPDIHVSIVVKLSNPDIHFRVCDFNRYSNKIPLQQKHWMGLFQSRPLADIMQRPDDRAMLRTIALNPRWRISESARAAIKAAFAQHTTRHTPLTAQTEEQRLAWLDEVDTVLIRKGDHAAPFSNHTQYPIRTFLAECSAEVDRPGSDGTDEALTLTGRTLEAVVTDDHGNDHHFGNAAARSWKDFLALFHPPEVADIATLNPETYNAHKHWLTRFAEYLTQQP